MTRAEGRIQDGGPHVCSCIALFCRSSPCESEGHYDNLGPMAGSRVDSVPCYEIQKVCIQIGRKAGEVGGGVQVAGDPPPYIADRFWRRKRGVVIWDVHITLKGNRMVAGLYPKGASVSMLSHENKVALGILNQYGNSYDRLDAEGPG